MFNQAAYENSRPDGIPVLEIAAPEGEHGPRLFVPLKRTELRGEVTGPLASLQLVQTYGYSREQCDRPLEAVYRFPLPGDAAVRGVTVRFGAVEIRAELKERGRAEAEYGQARAEGRQAALLTRESPNVFTLQVAGLRPDEPVSVETEYVQLARAEGEGWTLRIPLTTPPRYVRGDEAGSRHAEGQPLLLLRDPGHRFALDLRLVDAAGVTSPTHRLRTDGEDGALRVTLEDGEVVPDRDCVLAWQARRDREEPSLSVTLHADESHVYFLGLLKPPVQPPAERVPREVLLLLDHSGSMHGPKWQAADWAVERFLTDLREGDTFNLALFHTTTRWFRESPQPATSGTVGEAVEFLKRGKDSGGTELGVALEQALGQPRSVGERARHVLVVTDAQVSDAARLFRLASEEGREAARRRISILCVDAAPNSFLALELAERGGGVARFLTSSPEEEDITTALDEVLTEWSAPLLTGLRLEVSRDRLEPGGRTLLPAEDGWSAMDLGDLPAGRAAWLYGRVPRGDAADLAFRVVGENRRVAACRLPLSGASDGPAIRNLFGARRVLGLEYLIQSGYSGRDLREQIARLGYDPDEALATGGRSKVYAENARKEAGEALRELLVREALAYGLASAETAFVATRTERGEPIADTVAVANAQPSGWSDEFAAPMMAVSAGGAARYSLMASYPAPLSPPTPPPTPDLGGHVRDSASASADFDVPPFLRGGEVKKKKVALDPTQASLAQYAPPQSVPTQASGTMGAVRFQGMAQFAAGEAVLFDTARPEDAAALPYSVVFNRLRVSVPGGAPPAEELGTLVLLLYVEDLGSPRARVRLADLLRQGGERPLNVSRNAGQAVRLVLSDPSGAWASKSLQIEVELQ